MLKKISLSSFLLGFTTCFIILFLCVGTVTFFYLPKGITVSLGLGEVSPMVKEQVAEIIELQLPYYVESLKKEIPYIIDAEMTGQINTASIRIGDDEYPLPQDTIKGIEETFKSQVHVAMIRMLEGLDEKAVADSISNDVSQQIDGFIDKNVHNHTLNISPFNKLTIPITIEVCPEKDINLVKK